MKNKYTLSLVVLLFIIKTAIATPLTGIKTIPGDYATIALAVADLNLNGVGGGGVTFNIASGTTFNETPQTITATGTLLDQIKFIGLGTMPVINYTGTAGTVDAGFTLQGTDYITFDNLKINDLGTSTSDWTEMGFFLVRNTSVDACQNVTIKNCVIDLDRTSTVANQAAIWQKNSDKFGTTLEPTSAAGVFLNNKFYGNTITDAKIGFRIGGSTTSGLYDENTEIGVGAANNITFGGAGIPAGQMAAGILIGSGKNNTIANNNVSTGAGHNSYSFGIYALTATIVGHLNVYNNILSESLALAAGGLSIWEGINCSSSGTLTDTVNVFNNTVQNCQIASAGSTVSLNFKPITCGGSIGVINIYSNSIKNNTDNAPNFFGPGLPCSGVNNLQWNFIPIFVNTGTSALQVQNIYNNQISNNSFRGHFSGIQSTSTNSFIHDNVINNNTLLDGTGRLVVGIYIPGQTQSVYNNTISNLNAAAGAASAEVSGIRYYYGGTTTQVYNNDISLLSSDGNVTGIHYEAFGNCGPLPLSTSANIYNNTIHSLTCNTSTGSVRGVFSNWVDAYGNLGQLNFNVHDNSIYSFTGSTVTGISIGSYTQASVDNNSIHNLIATNGSSYGINVSGGTTHILNNNSINNIITFGTGLVCGINNSSNTSVNIHYNTINTLFSIGTASISGINSSAGTTINTNNNTINTLFSTGGGAVSGLSLSGGSIINTFNNKLYDLSSVATTGTVYGISVTGGTTHTIYNNMISDLRTSQADNINPINGLYLNGGTTIYVYYNSVYLSANTLSTGATFGTTGIYTNTTPNITLKNNLVVNQSVSSGTGLIVAHRRSGNSITNLTADYNSYLANVIGYDGTTTYSSLIAYQGWINETHAISVDPGFTNLADLHQADMSFANVIRLKGIPIAGISADIDAQGRNATTPDIGYDEDHSPLPIELMTFTGKNQGETNLLEWTTASEINNDYFTLERSIDGKVFEKIDIVKGAGNSTTQLNYNSVDNSPLLRRGAGGEVYYRLKQTDFNGDFTYSNIISIATGSHTELVEVQLSNLYPNPATDNFNYTLSSKEETEIDVKIIDVLGSQVSSSKFQVQVGLNNFKMDISEFSKGSYFLQVSNASGSYKEQKQLIVK